MSYELESDFPLVIYNEYDAKVLNGCTATIQELERLRDCKHKLDKYQKLIYILLNYKNVSLLDLITLSEGELNTFIQSRNNKIIPEDDITSFIENVEKGVLND